MYRQNKTKDIIFWIILSLTLALAIFLCVMQIISNARLSKAEQYLLCAVQSTTEETPSTEAPVQNVISAAEVMYVLGEKDGRLAIFSPDGQSVVDLLDTYIYSLPLTDREAIKTGILVYSVNELVALIQDYTS